MKSSDFVLNSVLPIIFDDKINFFFTIRNFTISPSSLYRTHFPNHCIVVANLYDCLNLYMHIQTIKLVILVASRSQDMLLVENLIELCTENRIKLFFANTDLFNYSIMSHVKLKFINLIFKSKSSNILMCDPIISLQSALQCPRIYLERVFLNYSCALLHTDSPYICQVFKKILSGPYKQSFFSIMSDFPVLNKYGLYSSLKELFFISSIFKIKRKQSALLLTRYHVLDIELH